MDVIKLPPRLYRFVVLLIDNRGDAKTSVEIANTRMGAAEVARIKHEGYVVADVAMVQ